MEITIIRDLLWVVSMILLVKYKLAFDAIVLYMKKKNHTPPSDEEIAACVRESIMRIIRK